MKRLIIQFLIGLAAGVVIVAGLVIFKAPYAYQGSLIEPPVPAPDFSLPAGDGATFTLSEQRGKIVLLFFGYTHCPDVCPTTLVDFQTIKARLGEQASSLRFVFVTVDPERDTLEALQKYVHTFDPTFIALGGEMKDLEPVWQAYGVYREKQVYGNEGSYFLDHTARIYVIDSRGQLRMTFPFGMSVEAMVDDLRHLLKE